jgi:hypothetical protein
VKVRTEWPVDTSPPGKFQGDVFNERLEGSNVPFCEDGLVGLDTAGRPHSKGLEGDYEARFHVKKLSEEGQ